MEQHQPRDFKRFVEEQNALRDAAGDQHWTLGKLRDPHLVEAIGARLRQYGIASFPAQTLGKGHMALVFPWHRHQIVRISDMATEGPRLADGRILQPVGALGNVEGFGIEVLPQVTTLQDAMKKGMVSRQEAGRMIKQLIASFARDGLFFWDCKIDNICVVRNAEGKRVPLVLDSGAVAPMREMYGGRIGSDTHSNMDKFKINLQGLSAFGENIAAAASSPEAYLIYLQQTMPPLNEDFADIQKRHAAALGLQHGYVQVPSVVYYGVVQPQARQQAALAQ